MKNIYINLLFLCFTVSTLLAQNKNANNKSSISIINNRINDSVFITQKHSNKTSINERSYDNEYINYILKKRKNLLLSDKKVSYKLDSTEKKSTLIINRKEDKINSKKNN